MACEPGPADAFQDCLADADLRCADITIYVPGAEVEAGGRIAAGVLVALDNPGPSGLAVGLSPVLRVDLSSETEWRNDTCVCARNFATERAMPLKQMAYYIAFIGLSV